MNTSTHVPLLFEVEYEKLVEREKEEGKKEEQTKNRKKGKRKKEEIEDGKMFYKHAKFDPEHTDIELYNYKSGIYTLIFLYYCSDMPICEQLSCIGNLLAFACDRSQKTKVTFNVREKDKEAVIEATKYKQRQIKKIQKKHNEKEN